MESDASHMLAIKNIKKGDLFIEEDMGMSCLFQAVSDAEVISNDEEQKYGYTLKVKYVMGDKPYGLSDDEPIELFECFEPLVKTSTECCYHALSPSISNRTG